MDIRSINYAKMQGYAVVKYQERPNNNNKNNINMKRSVRVLRQRDLV